VQEEGVIRYYRKGTADENAMREVKGYTFLLTDHGLSPRDLVVMDAGAHIGTFTDWALCEGARRVEAYEPHPENFKLLAKNCDNPRAILREAALVHDYRKETPLVIGKAHNPKIGTERFSTSRSLKGNIFVTNVKCFNFKKALMNIEAIKFDAEGAEYSLFNAIDIPRRVKWIVGEFDCGSSFLLPDGTSTGKINYPPQDYAPLWDLIDRIKFQGFDYHGPTNIKLPKDIRLIHFLFVRKKGGAK
jgi:FkbM family methyltransferase